jgi:hypothetical protein
MRVVVAGTNLVTVPLGKLTVELLEMTLEEFSSLILMASLHFGHSHPGLISVLALHALQVQSLW